MCCTACLAEEGKESRKGYSIYYYARANARASDSCEKSTRKQESRRFSISGKGRKGEKVPVWLKETRRAPAQDWQKKTLREPQNTGMADKKTASSIVKRKRFRIKIGMTGKKHGKSLHKTGRKKTLRKPPNTGIVEEFPSKESSRTENPFREMWIFPPESPEKSGKIMDTERKIFHTAREKARKWFERWGKNARKREAEAEKNRLFLRKEFRKSTENTGMRWKKFSALDKKISRWSEKI